MKTMPQQVKLAERLDLDIRINPISLLFKLCMIAAIALFINFLTSRNYTSKKFEVEEVKISQPARLSPPVPF
ncbi:hypothetical protein [Christiangramia aestuarii]|uniref:Uncharacterized protein n=1 Tax=Christiangramia aestuarii TaxID=1028746 RepID=A0A7K1LSJ6_9FLAO|nr:hypothetical protein [Christiangramia aestuarii]MUP43726.1 hypothetical protein [Christiangramia aestuarii]